MRIMVIGGTPIDTKMGCELLQVDGYAELIPISVSKTPAEQTFFQISTQEEKNDMMTQYIMEAKDNHCQVIVIYCNSLSASVDFESLSFRHGIPIVTPFFVYRQIASVSQKVGLLAANSQGLSGIERQMVKSNPEIEICAVACIDWVNQIERQLDPTVLMKQSGLKESIQLFEKKKVEVIVFGCTHFPYFFDIYQQNTSIPCINPDALILKQMKELKKQ